MEIVKNSSLKENISDILLSGNVSLNTIVSTILLASHPVGSYYWSDDPTDPGTLFGGTWERFVGKMLIGAAPEGTDWSSLGLSHSSGGYWYYNVGGTRYRVDPGQTGGSAGHLHSTGNHTLTTGEIPAHRHSFYINITHGDGQMVTAEYINAGLAYGSCRRRYADSTETDGGSGGAHNHGDTGISSNLPPYQAAYCWKRTA